MSKKASKNTSKKQDQPYAVLILSIVLLIVAAGLAVFASYGTFERGGISLGTFEFDFKSNKAVRSNDPSIDSVSKFLEENFIKLAACPKNNASVNIIEHSNDKTQILVGYGCGRVGDGRAFATKEGDNWKLLPITNNFTPMNIPACSLVDKYKLQPRIAPVCATRNDKSPKSINGYVYRLNK